MNELTLESLAKRVEALEKVIATKRPDRLTQGLAQSRRHVSRQRIHARSRSRNACGCVRLNGRQRGAENWPNDPS